MICLQCQTEFEGNFCPTCGSPAPQKVTCPTCGKEMEGTFCSNCGAKYIPPISERCKKLVDQNGNPLDVQEIATAYLSVRELKRFFTKFTNYNDAEIDELSQYIDANYDGYDYGILKAAALKSKLENAAKKPTATLTKSAPLATSPLIHKEETKTKRERIAENKRNGVACCPKCGSTSLSANKKGFGIGKAVIGAAITAPIAGPIGLVAGNAGAKKVWVTCLNCGHRWKL